MYTAVHTTPGALVFLRVCVRAFHGVCENLGKRDRLFYTNDEERTEEAAEMYDGVHQYHTCALQSTYTWEANTLHNVTQQIHVVVSCRRELDEGATKRTA